MKLLFAGNLKSKLTSLIEIDLSELTSMQLFSCLMERGYKTFVCLESDVKTYTSNGN